MTVRLHFPSFEFYKSPEIKHPFKSNYWNLSQIYHSWRTLDTFNHQKIGFRNYLYEQLFGMNLGR